MIKHFYNVYLDKLDNLKNVKVNFCLNDNGDVLIRFRPTKAHLD